MRSWCVGRLATALGSYGGDCGVHADAVIEIDHTRLTVAVNRTEALRLAETKAAPTARDAGLFVDIGSSPSSPASG